MEHGELERPEHAEYGTRVAVALVLGFLVGIVLENEGGGFWSGAAPLGAALFVLVFWRFFLRRWYVLILAVFLLGVGSGALRLMLAEDELGARAHALAPYVGTHVEAEGIVVAEADERASHTNLTLHIETLDAAPHEGRVLVRTERFPEFHYGDRVRASGQLEVPEVFVTDLERTFDYRGYLRARDITHTISFAHVEFIESGHGNFVIEGLLSLKSIFMENIERALPEPSAGLAEGITLGVKRALGEDLETAFRRTGIIHIVVLSGYNVSIVAEGIMRLLTFVALPRTRAIVGVLAISAFALIAGLSATVLRASLMASLILYARASLRAHSAFRALIFAGVVMLLFNPMLLLHDPGFQLSFLATAGLILLSPLIEKKLSLVPTKLGVREFLTATLATQIFILPFLLYMIGEFSIVSVLVNVLVLPAVPLAMLGTFLTGMFGMASVTLGTLAALPTHALLSYIITIAEFFGGFAFAAVAVPPFSFLVVAAAHAAATLFLYLSYRHNITQQNE